MGANTAWERHREASVAARQIDGGLGQAAMTAILEAPAGPARGAVAARWAARAAREVDQVAVIVPPDAGDDWVNARAEFMVAIHREAGW